MLGKLFEVVDTMSSQQHTQNDEGTTRTDDSAQTSQEADVSDMNTTNTPESSDEFAVEETAVSDLQAVAEQFNAAFNTALYELESSRRLIRERSAKIDELNESIRMISGSLEEETSKSRQKEEEYVRKAEELERITHEVVAERDHLQQQKAEQEAALNASIEEVGRLSQHNDELSRSHDQHKAEGLHAREEYAREKDALTGNLGEVQKKYEVARDQLDTAQKERDIMVIRILIY